jgi:hypothetical protein
MPRPKKVRNQRTIDDIVIEDPELAEALEQATENEEAAKLYRAARQTVKSRVVNEHPEVINAMLENGDARYFVVDGHRATYQTAERAAGTKPAPAGTTTRLEIYRLNDE